MQARSQRMLSSSIFIPNKNYYYSKTIDLIWNIPLYSIFTNFLYKAEVEKVNCDVIPVKQVSIGVDIQTVNTQVVG